VADVHRAAQQIVVLNPDGTKLRTLGGRGQGPGQFTNLVPTLGWLGDTLIALNYWGGERSVVLFSPSGSVVATQSRVPAGGGAPVRSNQPAITQKPIQLFSGGRAAFLLEIDLPFMGALNLDKPLVFPTREPHYHAFARDGSTRPLPNVPDSVTAMSGGLGSPVYCRSHDRKATQSFPPPFSDRGPLRAFVSPRLMAKAHQNAYRIEIIDVESGAVVRSIQRVTPRVPLRDQDWNALPEIKEIRGVEQELGGGRPYELAGAPGTPCPIYGMRPEFLPVLRTIVADETGRLWVEATAREGFTLALFDAAGRFIGEAAMPDRDPRVAPYVRGNLLYVVTMDEDGVQGIRVYDVRAGG
jgi:hypothetical protein